jgi:hypothetical protein
VNWTPAQLATLVLGVVFVVMGGVALLRSGLDLDLFNPVVVVGGLAYTPLLGLIELLVGLILLAVGAYPGASDAVVFIGVLLLAFGLLLIIEPGAFQESLAAGRAHGWFYAIVGGVAAAIGLSQPAMLRWYRSRSTHVDRSYDDRRYDDRGPSDTRRID